MARAKIAITLDDGLVASVDRLVAAGDFPNRSRAVEQAVAEKLERIGRIRLARESAKLDRSFERRLAEEGLGSDLAEWPEY
jgi:metal-responsive CopG/Arc/MetJ family transcriptional regulator